jgi:hypothetical protein
MARRPVGSSSYANASFRVGQLQRPRKNWSKNLGVLQPGFPDFSEGGQWGFAQPSISSAPTPPPTDETNAPIEGKCFSGWISRENKAERRYGNFGLWDGRFHGYQICLPSVQTRGSGCAVRCPFTRLKNVQHNTNLATCNICSIISDYQSM